MPQPLLFPLTMARATLGLTGCGPSMRGPLPADQQKPPDPPPPRLSLILFALAEMRSRGGNFLGAGPTFQGSLPLPVSSLTISGVTRNSSGTALGGCTVKIFRTADNAFIGSTVSDASGNYAYRIPAGGSAEQYFAVAYLAGTPDVAGSTVNALVGA